jgi:uncharacterized phage protein (TIGR01671 family)
MREIKFRGKEVGTGIWRYGYPIQLIGPSGKFAIYPLLGGGGWSVDPATVGQFTGLRDKEGTEIYEGDRVRYKHYLKRIKEPTESVVSFQICGFNLNPNNTAWNDFSCMIVLKKGGEVIGNIHDEASE